MKTARVNTGNPAPNRITGDWETNFTKHEVETPCDASYSVGFNAVLFVKIYFRCIFKTNTSKVVSTLTQQSRWNPLRFLFQQHITTSAEQTQSKQWVINHALNFILCAYNKDQLFYFLQKRNLQSTVVLQHQYPNQLPTFTRGIHANKTSSARLPFNTKSHTAPKTAVKKQKLNQFKNQVHFNSTETEMTAWINKRQNEILSSDHFALTQLPIQLQLNIKPKFSENKYIEITSLLQDLRQHYNQAALLFLPQKATH